MPGNYWNNVDQIIGSMKTALPQGYGHDLKRLI